MIIIPLISVNGYLMRMNPSPSQSSDYPDHCWLKEDGVYYKPREEPYQRKNHCELITCNPDFSMVFTG